MIYNLYCLYDKVAEVFFAPSAFMSDDLCRRETSFLVNHDAKFKASASDYEVVYCGTFNATSGFITSDNHRLLCRLSDLLERSESVDSDLS